MARKVSWGSDAWDDYMYWQGNDKAIVKKINGFIKECRRGTGLGTGKAELLGGDLSGWSSKRINQEHRLIYKLDADTVYILACRDHY